MFEHFVPLIGSRRSRPRGHRAISASALVFVTFFRGTFIHLFWITPLVRRHKDALRCDRNRHRYLFLFDAYSSKKEKDAKFRLAAATLLSLRMEARHLETETGRRPSLRRGSHDTSLLVRRAIPGMWPGRLERGRGSAGCVGRRGSSTDESAGERGSSRRRRALHLAHRCVRSIGGFVGVAAADPSPLVRDSSPGFSYCLLTANVDLDGKWEGHETHRSAGDHLLHAPRRSYFESCHLVETVPV